MLDASSLRRQVGKQAEAINRLIDPSGVEAPLRVRMGHTLVEITAGIAVGCAIAVIVQIWSQGN